jgi:hypothetical protein
MIPESVFKQIESIAEGLDMEASNEDMIELDMNGSGYVAFVDNLNNQILLPFSESGLEFNDLHHIVEIRREHTISYPKYIQQDVELDGVEENFSISTKVVVMSKDNLIPLLKECLKQFRTIKIN